jgi:hypothetical protein
MSKEGSTKSCIPVAYSVAHQKQIQWHTYFCGAPRPHAPHGSVVHRAWCTTKCFNYVAYGLVHHEILIFMAKILWRTTHAP